MHSHHRKAALAVAIVVGLLGLLLIEPGTPANAGERAAQTRCFEDQPCWHWPTMGNRKRGVIAQSGRRVIVGSCRFARMDGRGRIDWNATPRLRGDGWARRWGCR